MNSKYRVGIIGCGRIAGMLEDDPLRGKPCTHAGAFNAVQETKMIAACDINKERLNKFGKRWNVSNLYTNYYKMLKKEAIDIVSVAAWTQFHHEMVVAAAESGVQGIYCEKPMALTLDQAEEMLNVCNENNVKIVINHERRWDPYYLKVKKIIEEGKIGELKTIIGNTLACDQEAKKVAIYGGGVMFHDGTHLTDLLRFFAGEPGWVSAYEERPNGAEYIENTVFGLVWFLKGTKAFLEGGGSRNYFNFELDLQGTEGRIIIGNGTKELYVTKKSKRFSGFKELERIELPAPDNNANSFISGVKDLIRCIETGCESNSSGEDGKKALEIICALYESARNEGKRVSIPLS